MMKPRAYITRRLPQAAIDIVSAACETTLWDDEANPVPRETLLRAVADVDGILTLLTDRVDTELLAAAPRLKVVANMAVGYDNVDLPALTARGVLLTNTPDVLTETTADLVWALILAASRRVVEGHRLIAAGGWTTWSPMFMVGQDVHGRNAGDRRRGTDRFRRGATRSWFRYADPVPQPASITRAGGADRRNPRRCHSLCAGAG
jgi:glyoxylate reductase